MTGLGLEGKMLLLKSCPRCKGDLLLRNDFDGFFLSCIQCGYARDYQPSPAKEAAASSDEKKPMVGASA